MGLADEVGGRAVTLVRGSASPLPPQLPPGERGLGVGPRPADHTPADTSSHESIRLAEALRRYHENVEEMQIPLDPEPEDVAAVRERARDCDLVVVGTINALDHSGQGALVNALLQAGANVLAVALRLPYDIAAYPAAPAYLCTYSLQPPSLHALADALWGRIPFTGHLPVTLPGV